MSFGGSATLESDDVNEPPGVKSDTYSNFSLSLDATQPLYRLDRTIRLGQARTREEKAKADYAVRTQQLIDRVVERYFGVLQARDDFRFAETNREAIGHQLRQAQERFEVGLIAITDVEEAKSRFDLAHGARDRGQERPSTTRARRCARRSGSTPRSLAALEADLPLAVPDPADIEAVDPTPRWSATCSMRSASPRGRDREGGDPARERPAREPTVDLVGRAAATDKNRKPTGGSEAVSASIGIRLQLPLYTGGRVSAETREARARHRESMHVQERARRDAVRQTRQAYLGVESAIARVGALRQAVVSSQSALDAVDAGFQVGTRTSVDVLDAQRDLFQARNDLAAARYDYIRNALKLRLAAGTLVPSDLDAINGWLE